MTRLLPVLTGFPPEAGGVLGVLLAGGWWLALLLGATVIGSCCCRESGRDCVQNCGVQAFPITFYGTVTSSSCSGVPVGTVLTFGPADYFGETDGVQIWHWPLTDSDPDLTVEWEASIFCADSGPCQTASLPGPCTTYSCEGFGGDASGLSLSSCDPLVMSGTYVCRADECIGGEGSFSVTFSE